MHNLVHPVYAYFSQHTVIKEHLFAMEIEKKNHTCMRSHKKSVLPESEKNEVFIKLQLYLGRF